MTDDATAGPDSLTQVRALLAAGRQPPLGEKLGIALVEAAYGHAAFEATPDGSSYNPMGSMHGGYISTILDSACGIAAHTALKAGYGYTTLVVPACDERRQRDHQGDRAIAVDGQACRAHGGDAL